MSTLNKTLTRHGYLFRIQLPANVALSPSSPCARNNGNCHTHALCADQGKKMVTKKLICLADWRRRVLLAVEDDIYILTLHSTVVEPLLL